MAAATDYPSAKFTATILNGQQSSGEINLKSHTLVGIYIPSTFDGTTISFAAAPGDESTFYPIYKEDGSALSLTVQASSFVRVDPSFLCGVSRIKLVVAAQTGDVTLTLATRPLT